MGVNYGKKSDSMKEMEKQSIPKAIKFFMMVKSKLKRFGLLNLHQVFVMQQIILSIKKF